MAPNPDAQSCLLKSQNSEDCNETPSLPLRLAVGRANKRPPTMNQPPVSDAYSANWKPLTKMVTHER